MIERDTPANHQVTPLQFLPGTIAIEYPSAGDDNGHVIRTLRESKAKLSELVELASRGEDVLISVRGKVKARLTRAPAGEGQASSRF